MEKCRRMKRPQCMSKNWMYSWLWKSSGRRQQFSSLGKLCDGKTDILMNWSTVKNHISTETGFGYSATRRTSFRSWFLVFQRGVPPACFFSTSMTPSRQEIDHPVLRFSSFNLNDTFMTGASSSYIFHKFVFFTNYDSIRRQWDSRNGRSEWDRFPYNACVKFTCCRDRTGRPVVFWAQGVAARIQGEFGGWWNSITGRLSRQFFSWSLLRADYKETWGFA